MQTSIPSPDPDLLSRVRGMLLGLAIGDALGNTSEGMTPGQRRAVHGQIRHYLPNRHLDGRAAGTPTDDTQLAFWTLEHLFAQGRIVPEKLADTFASHRIFGIGSTVRGFLRAYKEHRDGDWRGWGRPSAGNGALMRIAPVALLPWIADDEGGNVGRDPYDFLQEQAAVTASLTHNDPASTSSSVAFAVLCYELLTGRGLPGNAMWWLDRWIEVAAPLEGAREYEPRGGAFRGSRGTLTHFLDTEVRAALAAGRPTVEACNSWYSGTYLMETVPSVVYILARHGHNAEEAIVRAVNDTKDNDSVAAIVGAAVGAAHGLESMPPRWLDDLTGIIVGGDPGSVQRVVERACAAVESAAISRS